jgi:hypothetical protein
MNDAALVRGLERVGDLPRDRKRFVEWIGPLRNAIGQRRPFDEFHDQERPALALLRGRGMCAMFGWLSEASTWASRLKRASRS